MPCLEKADLSKLADEHITAQRAVIKNLRTRKDELVAEEKQLAQSEPGSDRHKQTRGAIAHLRRELDGEVETEPGSFKFVRDPLKKTAEERGAVLEAQYREREQFVFRDTTKVEGKERLASVFGLPTVTELQKLENKEISEELIARSTSLVLSKQTSRNPVDFIDSEGLEVKIPLGKTVEHHHIYNNVRLTENGEVDPKSFHVRYNPNSKAVELNIIPSYWNAEEHGRNTQFIGLLDGLHAGDDPITHLHYYRFRGAKEAQLKQKIQDDLPGKITESQQQVKKLEGQLTKLQARARDPVQFQQNLQTQIQAGEKELATLKAQAKGVLSKPKTQLSEEQLTRREAHDVKKREVNKLKRELKEAQEFSTIRADITSGQQRVQALDSQIKSINLTKIPKGAERDRVKAQRLDLVRQREIEKKEVDQKVKLLRSKGDVNSQITSVQRKLEGERAIAALKPNEAVNLFDRSNGFFSFDKGSAEKAAHTSYRPLLNEEISRYYVRESLSYLNREYGDNALPVLQQLTRNQYKKNLLQRAEAIGNKVKDNIPAR